MGDSRFFNIGSKKMSGLPPFCAPKKGQTPGQGFEASEGVPKFEKSIFDMKYSHKLMSLGNKQMRVNESREQEAKQQIDNPS